MKKFVDILYEGWTDQLKGGLADDVDLSSFDQRELLRGARVELEHVDDLMLAIEIASDHLFEDPDYYKKLSKMERE